MRRQVQELCWLKAMKQRGQLSNNEQKNYQRLQRGFQGELAFDQLCDHFLGDDINCLDDVTIDYQGDVLQMDKIINNKDIIYLVDIKNYQGNYIYENNSLKSGNLTFANNIIEQARRARRIFTRLCDEHHLQLTIKNIIVFINDKGRINLCDDLPEIVLNYEEIPTWLMSISHDDQIAHRDGWKKLVQKYQVPSFKTSRICTTERFKQLEKGIHCEKCGSFSLKTNRYTFQCVCGHVETKQIAFLRTICEYGLIMHHLPLKRSEIVKFFGKNYSTDYIKNTLINYFEPLNVNKKDGKYQNYGQPFDYWFENEFISFEKLEKRKNWQSSF